MVSSVSDDNGSYNTIKYGDDLFTTRGSERRAMDEGELFTPHPAKHDSMRHPPRRSPGVVRGHARDAFVSRDGSARRSNQFISEVIF
ncbi:MAG: hypothetical protein H8F28_10660 [Fibrella sp.]|nr:hypothetical protein [Armatimonadota bacterium]